MIKLPEILILWVYYIVILASACFCTFGTSFQLLKMRAWGVKSRMCPPYPQRDRKRLLNGAVCWNHRIKRVVPCRCLDGHVKEPYEMSMAFGARP